jgi:hypothetical protein
MLLREIVARLAEKQPRRHPLKFPHFALATWLLRLELPEGTQPDDARRLIADELKTLLRGRLPRIGNLDLEVAGFPWWIKLAYTLIPKLLLPVMSRTWRPLRWFPRYSPYAEAGNTFHELARCFTLEPRDPERVDPLLVSPLSWRTSTGHIAERASGVRAGGGRAIPFCCFSVLVRMRPGFGSSSSSAGCEGSGRASRSGAGTRSSWWPPVPRRPMTVPWER